MDEKHQIPRSPATREGLTAHNGQWTRHVESSSVEGAPTPSKVARGYSWTTLFAFTILCCASFGLILGCLNGDVMHRTLGATRTPSKPVTTTSVTVNVQPHFDHQAVDVSTSYPRLQFDLRKAEPRAQLARRQESPGGGNNSVPLETFSVDVPLLSSGGKVVGAGTLAGFADIKTNLDDSPSAVGCQVTLGVHEFPDAFNNSYNRPFVGSYTPPACIGDTNTVVMNLTVTSKGRQFDRLAIM